MKVIVFPLKENIEYLPEFVKTAYEESILHTFPSAITHIIILHPCIDYIESSFFRQ